MAKISHQHHETQPDQERHRRDDHIAGDGTEKRRQFPAGERPEYFHSPSSLVAP